MTTDGIRRRHALTGAAGIGLGLPVLAACGGDAGTATDPATDSPDGGSDGGALGPTSDVPVGGGTIFADQKVVVTQPTEGDFKAFTAVCTHQGCLVGQVADGQIQCPCHGSAFSIEDGSNVQGPSGSEAGSVGALSEVGISVEGDEISLT